MATPERIREACAALHAQGRAVSVHAVRAFLGKGAGSFGVIGPAVAEWKAERELARRAHDAAPADLAEATAVAVGSLWLLARRHAEDRIAAEREELAARLKAGNEAVAEAMQQADGLQASLDDLRGALAAAERHALAASERAARAEAEAAAWRERALAAGQALAERSSEVQALTDRLGELSLLLRRRDHSEIIAGQRQQGERIIEAVRAVLAGNAPHPMSPEEILAAMPDKFGLSASALKKRILMRVERGLHFAKAGGGSFLLLDAVETDLAEA